MDLLPVGIGLLVGALLGALAAGAIHPRRWEHFRAIRSEIAAARRLNPGW